MGSLSLRIFAPLSAAVLGLWGGLALVPASPAFAQQAESDLDVIENYREEYGQDAAETADEDLRTGTHGPWTFQMRFAGDWRTNRYLSEDNRKPSATLAPDISLWRRWSLGSLRLFTEVGAIAPTSLTDHRLDSSALFGTVELEGGRPGEGPVPYVSWEPWRAHEGGFGAHVVTFHTFSAGVRRAWGPTFVDLYLRRQAATIDSLEHNSIGLSAFHNIPIGHGLLNLRGEIEGRRFDWHRDGLEPGGREKQLRTRLRARAILPLADAVDMQLTADLHRTDSNRDGRSFTNFIVGPTILARLSF